MPKAIRAAASPGARRCAMARLSPMISSSAIAVAAFAAWFRMDDLASMKASFADQAVIFQRRHNWIMCFLYTGTFGSFISYSAGFPLLARTQFPAVDALQLAFLGPLVGALSRSMTGWVSDLRELSGYPLVRFRTTETSPRRETAHVREEGGVGFITTRSG